MFQVLISSSLRNSIKFFLRIILDLMGGNLMSQEVLTLISTAYLQQIVHVTSDLVIQRKLQFLQEFDVKLLNAPIYIPKERFC